jgi:OOP family OmpA-OmpF porin
MEMLSKQTLVRVTMGLALAAAATSIRADDRGWYFGFTGGHAQAALSRGAMDDVVLRGFALAGTPVVSGRSDLDDGDISLSLAGGYRFFQYFALEGGYVDFGTAKYRASGMVNAGGSLIPAGYSADFEAKGFTAAAVGAVPLHDGFELHAKLGSLFADTEISERLSGGGITVSDSFSSNSQDIFYGLGLGLHLGEHWNFSLDWQQFANVGDEDETGETDIDRYSLGVSFSL